MTNTLAIKIRTPLQREYAHEIFHAEHGRRAVGLTLDGRPIVLYIRASGTALLYCGWDNADNVSIENAVVVVSVNEIGGSRALAKIAEHIRARTGNV